MRLMMFGSLIFTYVFFFEYLTPSQSIYIPYDLNVYHYSLADYAFRALSAGRFPAWDPTMFCGIGFASNIQAGLFYPPTWLLFAANLGREHLSYWSLEVFQLAHVWLAFFLCHQWLRARRLSGLACLLGAGAYAFGGFVCLNLQHLGLVAAYAWFPLGLHAIDVYVRTQNWIHLLRLVAASTLAFLAGYPPTWFVFVVFVAIYAAFNFNIRAFIGTCAALLASLVVAAVQFFPTLQASAAKIAEDKYGSGINVARVLTSYLVPNYYNFGLNISISENPGAEYLYLGAPVIVGLVFLLGHWRTRLLAPFLAAGAVGWVLMTNPFNAVWSIIKHFRLLAEVCRSDYFLAAPMLALTPLAAIGIDDFLRSKPRRVPNWLVIVTIILCVSYSGWQIARWTNTAGFPAGGKSAYDAGLTLLLLSMALYAVRAQTGIMRNVLAGVILLLVGVDYKVFGTSKRFNAAIGEGTSAFATSPAWPEMDAEAFRQIRTHSEYRTLLDSGGGPSPLELRHFPVNSPQGFDPFFTTKYRETLREIAHATFTERDQFTIDPGQDEALKLYGVRYFVTTEPGRFYRDLLANRNYRLAGAGDRYFKVFEYLGSHPPFGWETESVDRTVRLSEWSPERRVFDVNSDAGGSFTLSEQFLPGWEAAIDGNAVRPQPWKKAFQSVAVPAGSHRVEFRFHSTSLLFGAAVSLVAVALLTASALVIRAR